MLTALIHIPQIASQVLVNAASRAVLDSSKRLPSYSSRQAMDLINRAINWDDGNWVAKRNLGLLLVADLKAEQAMPYLDNWMDAAGILRRRGWNLLSAANVGQSIYPRPAPFTQNCIGEDCVDEALSHLETAAMLETPYFSTLLDLASLYRETLDTPNWTRVVKLIDRRYNELVSNYSQEIVEAFEKNQIRSEIVQNLIWGTYWSMELDRRQGNLDAAVVKLHKLLSFDSQFPYAHLSLGEALLYMGRCDEAIPYLTEASERYNELFWPQYYLGRCYEELGQLNLAEQAYGDASTKKAVMAVKEGIYNRIVIWGPLSVQRSQEKISK